MGMSISAKLIYGLPYKDVPEDIRDEVDELLDNGEIDVASPWYDSSREHWVVGIEVACDGVILPDLVVCVNDAWHEVPEILHTHEPELKLYVCPDVI